MGGCKRAPNLEALSRDEAGAEPSTARAVAASTASGAARCAGAASATRVVKGRPRAVGVPGDNVHDRGHNNL